MKTHKTEKCPKCDAALMVDITSKEYGIRKVGCKGCNVWSEPHLSEMFAVGNFKRLINE